MYKIVLFLQIWILRYLGIYKQNEQKSHRNYLQNLQNYRNHKANNLKIWKDLKHVYRTFYILEDNNFGVFATSVPDEILFSKVKNTIRGERNRQVNKLLSKFLFL